MTISLAKSNVLALWCETILFGMYTVLTGGALYLLLRRQQKRTASSTRIVMIILTVAMYSLSLVHMAFVMQVELVALFEQGAIEGHPSLFNDETSPLKYLQNGVALLNCLIGDAIVAWRAWSLWGRDWRVLVFPVTCITAGLGFSISAVVTSAHPEAGSELFSGNTTIWGALIGGLSVVSNLHAVILISITAWKHKQALKAAGMTVPSKCVIGILVIIVESGMVYCIAVIICTFTFIIDIGAFNIVGNSLVTLAGIYPTIIIVLVCMKMSCEDEITRATTLEFRVDRTTTVRQAVDSDQLQYTSEHTVDFGVRPESQESKYPPYDASNSATDPESTSTKVEETV